MAKKQEAEADEEPNLSGKVNFDSVSECHSDLLVVVNELGLGLLDVWEKCEKGLVADKRREVGKKSLSDWFSIVSASILLAASLLALVCLFLHGIYRTLEAAFWVFALFTSLAGLSLVKARLVLRFGVELRWLIGVIFAVVIGDSWGRVESASHAIETVVLAVVLLAHYLASSDYIKALRRVEQLNQHLSVLRATLPLVLHSAGTAPAASKPMPPQKGCARMWTFWRR